MTSKLIDRRDLSFILYEWLNAEGLTTRVRYADHSRETFDATIDTAYAIAEGHFAPHAHKADENEPTFDGERVSMIPEVKAAIDAYVEAGFPAATHDYDRGGMQLPYTVNAACGALFKAANVGTSGYPFLTNAAANLLNAHASDEQKERYLVPMLDGRFFGTMALTEPQAGSSLADIRTTATHVEGDEYRLTGSKIFISAGDHELSENIVHMVLGRIKGAPAGVKGISLFIVPKFLVNDDGTLGARNDVVLAGLIHKMGYRGTTSTMLNFGENDDCRAYLLGEPNKGLTYMFHMMNEARVGVGIGAAAIGYSGYLYALDYARNRPQGRHPDSKDPAAKQVPIIEHADIRRMLLAQKAYVEGALGLCLYAARLVDDTRTGEDDETRSRAKGLLDVLTPIVKSWPSQYGLEANSLAIQVHGGYGYTREYPVERLYRDNRLNPIHEGTHGIQGMDLLGRKVPMNGGAAFQALLDEISATADAARSGNDSELAGHGERLAEALATVSETTGALAAAAGQPRLYLANASVYLEMVGHVVVAWVWLSQALAARRALDAGEGINEAGFYKGKLAACRYFFAWELPRIGSWAKGLSRLDRTCLDMEDAWF
ncbi:MAG: acyl-CoA dehydrogenase [Rhodospirillales bacterium]|nr:acyl-CoA dehydrogenase [Rhodospirillales bacterium]